MSNHGWVSSHSSPMNPAPLKVSSSSISRQQQSKFQIQWFNMYAINSFNYETRANKIYLFPYFRICSISWMNWISYTFFFYHLELPWDWPLTIELKFNFSNSQFSVFSSSESSAFQILSFLFILLPSLCTKFSHIQMRWTRYCHFEPS